MAPVVQVDREGDIAWVVIDNPPVNATSTSVREGLMQAVDEVKGARVAVLLCEGRTFVAGGDMAEFDRPAAAPHLPDLVQRIEDSPTPFVAVMHGNVLGGGFELAMACAWRIAKPGTRFGLPEVNVGLIPGAGGSQRAPRLVGMRVAIDMACRGKTLSAEELLELGGIDALVQGDPRNAARDFVANLPARLIPVSQRSVETMTADALAEAHAALKKTAKGQQSPLLNLDALQWASLPFAEGQKRERARHLELRRSAESRALRYAFFAERAAGKPSAIADASPREVGHVAIVGGGLMGAGVATACLSGGLKVTLIEQSRDAALSARTRVTGLIEGALQRGKITEGEFRSYVAALAVTDRYADARGADLAIEAVFEDLDVKREVFGQLAAVMRDEAILATNTSYIDPGLIFEGIANPARCLGLHFFSPAHIMKLLEIVRTPATSAEVLATGFSLARRLRKVSVLSGICDGFIGNRMLAAYRREAEYLLADGALPHDVDRAMRAFGLPMGPWELQDLTGLQIAWANRKSQASTRDPNERYVTIADELCEAGRLGQRCGKGWYRYKDGARIPERDPEVEELIISYSIERNIDRRPFTDDEISSRILAVLANEGARIVEEGIAERADDVDMVQVHGYGFPRWRGGPMHHADGQGWDQIASTMSQVARESPNSWILADKISSN